MNIIRESIPVSTIQEFAVKHGLTMKVVERGAHRSPGVERFYACFENSETKEGCILRGSFGNGDTEAEAIENYAAEISEKLLVTGAFTKDRREIQVPRLVQRA